MTRRTAAPLALSLLLLAPASASAAQEKCAKTATVKDGDVQHFLKAPLEGEPLEGTTIRRRSGYYKADSAVKLSYAGNTYSIESGAMFKIVCYGKSVRSGLTLPALDLLSGEVTVKTDAKKPGGVVTTEALSDPRSDPTMTFSVSRTLRDGEPDADDIVAWIAGYISSPKGTTRVKSDGKPIVGVTPYVGSKRGVCRYVHGAKLTSKGTSKGFFTGTATYTP